MIIRNIVQNDLPHLAKLAQDTYAETFGHTLTENELEEALKTRSTEYFSSIMDKDVILVAEIDSTLAGFIQFGHPSYKDLSFEKGDIELNKVYVNQAFQGQGLGKQLMEAMLTHSRAKDARNIYLDVFTENDKAINMYKKFGFEIIGKTPFEINGEILGYDLLMKKVNNS